MHYLLDTSKNAIRLDGVFFDVLLIVRKLDGMYASSFES